MNLIRRIQGPVAAVLLSLALVLPAAAESAGSLYGKGEKAELRQDYATAFEFYRQAFEKKPSELKYKISYYRARFLAAAQLVNRGQALREQGKMEEALAEFERAAAIDPTMSVAQQEIRRTREMMAAPAPQGAAKPTGTGAEEGGSFRRRANRAAGPVELAPIENKPITLSATEDTKVLFETIGKIAGINVLFDPDFTGRRLRLQLNGVSLQEALETLALQSKTFWRAVTPNTIMVAADTKAKRDEIEQNVVKTIYLSNISGQAEIQDVINAIRQLTDMTRVQNLPAQSAIMVRGTPDQVTLAEKIVMDVDRPRAEVIVDVAVMQVRRDKLREIGVRWPTSASIAIQPPTTTTNTGTGTGGTTNGGTTTTATTNNGVNLNVLGNLRATDFVVNIPAASVNALMTDANTRLLQNPQIRALNNAKATLKIGDRVPVAVGSFQPGIGGVGINPLVNTQFNYVDVGVNVDITPVIHIGGDVTLKLLLDVSSVTGRVSIGGIDQPIISQRKVEHEIRLREGEVNLVGGIFEESDTKSISGIPYLSQVPFLKYFFGSERKETVDSEIIFVLSPRIVRANEFTEANARAIDVGAGVRGVTLRERAAGPAIVTTAGTTTTFAGSVPPPAAGAAATAPAAQPPASTTPNGAQQTTAAPAVQPGTQQSAPGTTAPGTTAPATVTAPDTPAPAPAQQQPPQPPAGGVALSLNPSTPSPAMGTTFTVNLDLTGAADVYAVPVQITYDPAVLQLLNISSGELLSKDGLAVALVHREDPPGTVKITASRPPLAAGVSGNGTVFTLTFLGKSRGQTAIAITQPGARNRDMQQIPATGSASTVVVR